MSNRRTPNAAELGLPDHVKCPFCEGSDTELHSAFGPQLSVATYWCRRCHTAFDWIKRAPKDPEAPSRRSRADRR